MRKTKIICTLGPSTDKDGVLRELIANGMNVGWWFRPCPEFTVWERTRSKLRRW